MPPNVMRFIRILTIALFFMSMPLQARMYQWNDPDTGTTQLSGKPPAWYRTNDNGPRIIVFDKGRIIDDTAIEVSDEQREALRQSALLKAEEDRERAMDLAREAEEMKSRINMATTEDTSSGPEDEPPVTETPVTPVENMAPQPDQEDLTEEQMRILISEWEKQMTEQAKKKTGALLDEKPVE